MDASPSTSCVPRCRLCAAISRRCRAYTLVELFLTIAVLMIVLGLMVKLANRVRRESADRATRQLLQRLGTLMDTYIAAHGGEPPELTAFLNTSAPVVESDLLQVAERNNVEFLNTLGLIQPKSYKDITPDDLRNNLRRLGDGRVVLEDPWGRPIVFMARQNPAIGMAPADHPFFFSAGPDQAFLTREDNLYSYEENAER